MKTRLQFEVVALTVALVVSLPVFAEAEPPAGTLAATLEIFVFPAEGQAPGQQSKDEVECYDWATANTGSDPFQLLKDIAESEEQTEQAKADAKQTGQGRGAAGAIRGAAAGALIGEIANDDASEGAALGAAVGLVGGRRSGRIARSQAVQQAEQQEQASQEVSAEQIENFKKAMTVCLEAKDYMVKY